MYPTRNQRTLAAVAAVEGVGYWSSEDVRVEFHPAEAHAGIVFVRDDLPGRPRIAAAVANRTDTPLRTTLRQAGAEVAMVEHVMAALAGLQIDNCEVHVDRPEIPGLDGSCLPVVEALDAAGVVEQDAPKNQRPVHHITRLGDEENWIEARPCRFAKQTLRYELDYGDQTAIGQQTFEIALSIDAFRTELAPSRTFVLEHEADALKAQGLGRRTTCGDLLVFGPDGPIDNSLRFPNECARHKILDMVGDLALAGCELSGHFVAYRSGHRLNAALVKTILAENQGHAELKRCA